MADVEMGDAPQGNVRQGDAPQGDAPQGDAPQGDAPQGDAPQQTTSGVTLQGVDHGLTEWLKVIIGRRIRNHLANYSNQEPPKHTPEHFAEQLNNIWGTMPPYELA